MRINNIIIIYIFARFSIFSNRYSSVSVDYY